MDVETELTRQQQALCKLLCAKRSSLPCHTVFQAVLEEFEKTKATLLKKIAELDQKAVFLSSALCTQTDKFLKYENRLKERYWGCNLKKVNLQNTIRSLFKKTTTLRGEIQFLQKAKSLQQHWALMQEHLSLNTSDITLSERLRIIHLGEQTLIVFQPFQDHLFVKQMVDDYQELKESFAYRSLQEFSNLDPVLYLRETEQYSQLFELCNYRTEASSVLVSGLLIQFSTLFLPKEDSIKDIPEVFSWFSTQVLPKGWILEENLPMHWELQSKMLETFNCRLGAYIRDCFSVKEPTEEEVDFLLAGIKAFDKAHNIAPSKLLPKVTGHLSVVVLRLRQELLKATQKPDSVLQDHLLWQNAKDLFFSFAKEIKKHGFSQEATEKFTLEIKPCLENYVLLLKERSQTPSDIQISLNTLLYLREMCKRTESKLGQLKIFVDEIVSIIETEKKLLSDYEKKLSKELSLLNKKKHVQIYSKSLVPARNLLAEEVLQINETQFRRLLRHTQEQELLSKLYTKIVESTFSFLETVLLSCTGLSVQGAEEFLLSIATIRQQHLQYQKELPDLTAKFPQQSRVEALLKTLLLPLDNLEHFVISVVSLFGIESLAVLPTIFKLKGIPSKQQARIEHLLRMHSIHTQAQLTAGS